MTPYRNLNKTLVTIQNTVIEILTSNRVFLLTRDMTLEAEIARCNSSKVNYHHIFKSMEITKQTTQILLKQRQQKCSSSHEKKNHGTIKNESNTIIDETI